MNSTLLSIVVPVYNVSKYIKRCIESLINQDLNDIEIILINDGSTDDSLDICREYEKKFGNITVYSRDNSGLGATRNYGTNIAKGKYIAFVDSDDYVEKNMYKYMCTLIQKNDCDLCVCNYEMVYDKRIKSDSKQINNTATIYSDKYEIIKEYLLFHIQPFAWNKIYKREFLINNNIKFQEKTFYEDIVTTLNCLCLSKRIVVTNAKLYNYYQRDTSIMHSVTNKHMNDYINQINKFYNFIYSNYDIKLIEFELRVSKFRLTYNLLGILKEIGNYNILNNKFEKFYNDVIIFGASEGGSLLKYYFEKYNIRVKYFCDNSREKWGNKFEGIEIIKPQYLYQNTECDIFIASMYYDSIYLQLKEMNLHGRILDLDVF